MEDNWQLYAYLERSPTLIWMAQVSSLAFRCSQLLSVCAFKLKYKLRQFILTLSSVALTSILAHSHRLRITALLSSGCKATVEGLSNVQSSSTTHNSDRATTMLDGNCMYHVSKIQSIFISRRLKVIPYAVILYSAVLT